MVNMVKITDYMSTDLICLDLKGKDKDSVLLELSKLMENSPNIVANDNIIYHALLDREKIGSTGIGKGVAIPHAKTDGALKLTVAFGIDRHMVNFDSLDKQPVEIFFVFASPHQDSQVYLKVLARISRLIRDEKFRQGLLECKTPQEVIDYINKKEIE